MRRWVVRLTAVLSGGGVARPPLADARQQTGCMAMPVGASFQKIPVVHQCLLKTSSTCSAVQIRHLVLFYWFGRLHFHHPSVTLIGAPRLGFAAEEGGMRAIRAPPDTGREHARRPGQTMTAPGMPGAAVRKGARLPPRRPPTDRGPSGPAVAAPGGRLALLTRHSWRDTGCHRRRVATACSRSDP